MSLSSSSYMRPESPSDCTYVVRTVRRPCVSGRDADGTLLGATGPSGVDKEVCSRGGTWGVGNQRGSTGLNIRFGVKT